MEQNLEKDTYEVLCMGDAPEEGIVSYIEKYEQAGSYPVSLDYENLKKLGVTLCSKKLIEDSKEGLVRHSSTRVARAIYYWYRKVLRDGNASFSIKTEEKQECNV